MEPEHEPNANSPPPAPPPPLPPSLAPSPSPSPPSLTLPSSRPLNHLAESLKLEHQLLRVPFEHLKKSMRNNHRIVEKEISTVISSVSDAANRSDNISDQEAVNHLTSLVSRLQGLKRKLEEGSVTEQLQAQRCRVRIEHLEGADVENSSEWNNTRLKRILVDYMLRLSYYDTAEKLAESGNIVVLVLFTGSYALIAGCYNMGL
ncbi:hypothetical protein GIB67_018477 [Kingdonia uniflora]|uniref:LisH domain-containing protein n=1 Tax=Kingdonia uniflora TaxID=39325 RepID=A0A7J7LW88_9MAGN|nr:hypothetical protein GIB67_018477 [Kingdonia uniflora]